MHKPGGSAALVGRKGDEQIIGDLLQLDQVRIRSVNHDLVGSAVDKTAERRAIRGFAVRHNVAGAERIGGEVDIVGVRRIGERGASTAATHRHVHCFADKLLWRCGVERDGLPVGERVVHVECAAGCDCRSQERLLLRLGCLLERGGELDRGVIDDMDVIHAAVIQAADRDRGTTRRLEAAIHDLVPILEAVGRIEADRVAGCVHDASFTAENDAKREVVGVHADDLVVAVRREAADCRVAVGVIPGRVAIPEAVAGDLERVGGGVHRLEDVIGGRDHALGRRRRRHRDRAR